MTTVSIRCDSYEKAAAAEVAEYYGFDLSSVTRAFWKEMARTQSIPLNFGRDRAVNVGGERSEILMAKADKEAIIQSVQTVCKRYPQIEKAWIFGSVARGETRHDSDIDLVLDLDRNQRFTLFDLGHLAQEVENLTSRECDVVTSRKLRDANFAASVNRDKELVYER